jgi:hypothetical protein
MLINYSWGKGGKWIYSAVKFSKEVPEIQIWKLSTYSLYLNLGVGWDHLRVGIGREEESQVLGPRTPQPSSGRKYEE